LFGGAGLKIANTLGLEMIATVWWITRSGNVGKLLVLAHLIDPMPFGSHSHLTSGPAAFAADCKQAAVRVFEIPFASGNGRRNRLATFGAFEQKHMNKRIHIVIHNSP
jgi:hypothetical protein